MEKIFIYDNQETNYIITSDGRVINRKTNKELKGTLARNEYCSVQLTINGKPKSFMVHRLVAEMFCDNPNNYQIVDHIDRNKYNNDYTNLRWVDNSTNALNAQKENFQQKNLKIENIDPLIWKEVKDFSNYMVNKDGQIINVKTKRYLFGSLRNGYIRVSLNNHFYSLHKIIWEAFNGEIPKNGIIDHIDGNRQNNKLSNLRLVTQSQNILNSHLNGGHDGDVSVKQYDLQGNYITSYPSMKMAAEAVGLTRDAVRQAANRYGTCANYFWIREDVDITIEEVMKITKANKPKKTYCGVTQYSLDGKKISYFNSLKEAARSVGCADSTIKRAADNYRSGKGYIWVLDTQKIEDFIKNVQP